MKILLSCVVSELGSYGLNFVRLIGQTSGDCDEVRISTDCANGTPVSLQDLASYICECELVIYLVGDACGARPSAEEVRSFFESVGKEVPVTLTEYSYLQWEYELSREFGIRTLVYFAEPDAPLRISFVRFTGRKHRQRFRIR